MPYTDHLGNTFSSLPAMAEHWNIPKSTLYNRLNKGMTTEQALTYTTADMKQQNTECKDHLGNTYASKTAMCEAYNISHTVFFARVRLGWSLEQALTTPVNNQPTNSKSIKDHTGKEFKSVSAMCKHWGIKQNTYNARIKQGWSVEKTLTTATKSIKIVKKQSIDHLGNKYPSMTAMCNAYNITHYTFASRLNLGWTLEQALTTPQIIHAKSCNDNMGHTFPTLADMCRFYGVPVYRLQGKSLSKSQQHKVLISHFKPGTTIQNIYIEKIIEFPFYLCTDTSTEHESIYTFDTLLDLYHNDNFYPLPETKVKLIGLTIKSCTKFPYYKVIYKDQEEIWDYWKIIQYRHDSNFGLSSIKETTT